MPDKTILRHVMNSISSITEEDWSLIEPAIQTKTFAKNQYLLKANQACDSIGFVSKGAFRMFYIDKTGEEITTHFTLEHDFVVSYESYITRLPSKFYIQAMEDSQILYYSRETVERLFKISHNWERFGRIIAEQVFVLSQKRFQSLMFQSAEERYFQILKDYPQVFQRVPQYLIASYLGIKPQSLSRIRKNLTLS